MTTPSNFAAHPTIPGDRDVLLCVFQRGAADGLNSLIPYSDPDYYLQRPSIGVAAPGQIGGGIYVDADFALHPALAALKPIYDAGDMALVHATGVPHRIRSHFSAQNLIERGLTAKTGPTSGWLGRHLAQSPAASSSTFRAISISGNVPIALTGASDPLAIDNLAEFGFDQGIVDSGYPQVLAAMFRHPMPFAGPAGAALVALEELQAADLAAITPDNGAVYPESRLAGKFLQAAQLIKSRLPVEVICLDSDGWDHHERLPEFIGAALAELAGALSAFYTDMGSGMSRITVLVYTEFGRRVAENGSLGADHGTASLAYLMGGGVNGGQVVCDWPGLDSPNLEYGEDLKITTDLRTVIVELLNRRLGGTDIDSVFPGFSGATSVNAFLANR